MSAIRKIILFGGSFDPIHNGHLEMAKVVREQLNADDFIFIPARRSPHKSNSPKADGIDRVKMIQIAVEGTAGLSVSDCELDRPEPSYTFDTVEYFGQHYPDAELFWLVGADAIADLDRWYRITELVDICNVCVMYRAGYEKPKFDSLAERLGRQRVEKLTRNVVETPLIDLSSTQIRQDLEANLDVRALLPAGVYDYIKDKKLY